MSKAAITFLLLAGLSVSPLTGFCAMAEQPGSAGVFPWKAGDRPPLVDGLQLGEPEAKVKAQIGQPDETLPIGDTPDDGYFLKYPAKGMSLSITPSDGLSIISLDKPNSGEIGGIAVGENVNDLVAAWGQPQTINGTTGSYSAGDWGVVVNLDSTSTSVVSLILGYNQNKFAMPVNPLPSSARILPNNETSSTVQHVLPFTAAQNADGARWVWFIVNQEVHVPYVAAADFPKSPNWRAVPPGSAPQDGDVAWWPGYVTIYAAEKNAYYSAEGTIPAATLNAHRGVPVFYRLWGNH
jgi:hypothetical protein